MITRAPFFPKLAITSSARFNSTRTHRYSLWRIWNENIKPLVVIGLNPSTADEYENDPTVSKCIVWAREWGFGGLIMLNIFAYRATDPKEMKRHPEPVGEDNNKHILKHCERAGLILCAWGNDGAFRDRAKEVLALLESFDLYCMGTNQDGSPKHPLYLKYKTKRELYRKKLKSA